MKCFEVEKVNVEVYWTVSDFEKSG
ncbi:hypothetical protein A2U01_0110158, partial [Trifolium medium]|nr:hypothetical protein [Trifolium medium]